MKLCLTVFLISLILAQVGCGAPNRQVTLTTWQKEVAYHVNERANGDFNALAESTIAGGYPGLAVIGFAEVKNSTDYIGLLIGLPNINHQMHMVYLVAEIKKGTLVDIWPVAVHAEKGKLQWHIGLSDKKATRTYRDFVFDDYQHRHSDKSNAKPFLLGFPQPADRFNLQHQGKTITITHTPSGARWMIVLTVK